MIRELHLSRCMPNFSRTQLITTLSMMLNAVQDNTDMEINRTMALSMFEVTLRYYNLLTQGNGDKKLIQTCYDKVKCLKMITDLQSMFINSKNLLGRHPCVDRSGYLNVSLSL